MANEYGDLEQLVNDVTSIDTARMTLRWALERLNTIEKEKADLKKNLALAEETAKRLQVKEASLTDAYSSRSKTLEEKEDFYTKLEATMSLLGEGKLDIQQLLKKEAKLDSLRHSLENEYSDKFEELDRNQRSVIERWNARLLEVESQYAGRLAQAQTKYDGLRAELEGDYQGRMTALQASFKSRERTLSERILGLETSVRQSEEKVETRRRELEGEYLSKKRETEENYRKLKSMLEAGLEDKIRAMDCDHAEQVRSFEASWQIERARLLQEQHVREAQYASAQDRIKEIENALAVQQEAHHSELLKIISEKETAFRGQLADLESEKSAKEATVRELQARLEKKAAAWDADRARLQSEFDARLESMEAGLREHTVSLEREYAVKKEEIENLIAVSREEAKKEFDLRLSAERKKLDAEKARLETEKQEREEALALNSSRLKELENALAATREEHHRDLMERIRSGENSFREKLAGFEEEKQAYNKTINDLTGEIRQRDAFVLEAKRKIAAEFEAKAAVYEQRLARTEALFEERRLAYEERIGALSVKLEEAARASAAEKERFRNEISRLSDEAGEIAEKRAAGIRADYEARKAALDSDFSAKMQAVHSEASAQIEFERKNWNAERSRFENALVEVSENLKGSQEEIERLNARLREGVADNAQKEAQFTRELAESRVTYEKELSSRVKELASAQSADLLEAVEVLKVNEADLTAALEDKENVIKTLKAEAIQEKRDCELRIIASVSGAVALRREELEKAYARNQAALEEDYRARRAALAGECSLDSGRLAEENSALRASLEKAQASAAETSSKAAALAEKLLQAEKDFHDEKLRLQKAQLEEFDSGVAEAVNVAVENIETKLRHAQEELAKVKKESLEEMDILNEGFAGEKDRLLEEIERRDQYIEAADAKLQDLEYGMMKYRQTASGELIRNISEQDARFRELAADEKERSAARVKQLEDLLAAKEKLLADSDKFYRQKQLDLDALHAELNMRVNSSNEDIFAQKRSLGEKEKALNELKLKLEKEYAAKSSELEPLKMELTRAIMDYKGGK
ncbi:MAG: hypothetical protein COX65_02850 [Elusimicrobia bacterium CG_4_10_14_0_2_um_filter_56_8]|nr:MAG: hypothetical protein COX65_02850 [Elusimicrobia bacterium CG_4_10_14_0_2_um_filter_56_8]